MIWLGLPRFCVMCGEEATVLAEFQTGCVCRPDDKEQWLCEQHWEQSEPIGGGANVVVDLLNKKMYPRRYT